MAPDRPSWPTVTLNEVCGLSSGKSLPKKLWSPDGSVPIMGASKIIGYTDEATHDAATITIGRVGACGTVNRVQGPVWVTDNALIASPRNGVDEGFLYYWLKNKDFRSIIGGSTQPLITQTAVKAFEVKLPPVDDQRRIAGVLSALDRKVEANFTVAHKLDELSRGLWFRRFGAVQLSAPVPAGWADGTLADLATTQYGHTASAIGDPVGPRFLRVTDINKRNWVEWDQVPYCPADSLNGDKHRLRRGDIVVARMADPGKAAIIEDDVDAVFASYLVRLKTENLATAYFVYGFLKSPFYENYAASAKSGSVQQNMNAKVIVGARVVTPPEQEMAQHFEEVAPFRHLLAQLLAESARLAQLRDGLMPKLITGDIRVAENYSPERDALAAV